jgi:DNA-binding MarR family transcriptional regulator
MRKPKITPDSGKTSENLAANVAEKAPTKSAIVLSLLAREQGATLAELIEATDWLPHTTRAALTGLRKKGHAIDRRKRGDATCYPLLATEA